MIPLITALFFLNFLRSKICSSDNQSPQIQIRDGPVRGSISEYRGIRVIHFKGIPYAKPPVDTNRFLPPMRPEPWHDPIDGSKYGSSCKQPLKAASNEDCLYANVFVAEKSFYERKNLPVMVLIHGGWFLFGSGNLVDDMPPDPLVSLHNIILVSFNYRLGPHGFFYAGSDITTGIKTNLGFRDQIFALQWVQDNIGYFGGDPSQVTIFGYSSGAESVGLHLLTTASRDLFKNAIMESGAAWYGKNKRDEIISSSKAIIEHFGCSGQSDMIGCLQKVDSDELLMNSTRDALDENPLISGFRPIFESDELLPLTTSHAIRGGNFSMGKNLLVGTEKDDVAFILKFRSFSWMRNFTYDQAVDGMKIFTRKPSSKFFVEYYLDPHRNGSISAIERTILDFANDLYFECPTYMFAGLIANTTHERQPSVYAYWHTQKPKTSTYCGNITEAGPCHTDELAFVYGAPSRQPELYSREDDELSHRMMYIWTHFAKTGQVPPQGPVDWPSLGSGQKGNYIMELNNRRIGVMYHEKFDFCITNWRHFHQFWDPESIHEYNH